MSCGYADGLSPYPDKGVLGVPEKFDSPQKVKEKCKLLAGMIKEAKHAVVHTGAGISTSAGIPDFRGPNGVWTLEERGLKPDAGISFNDAKPTKTHMAIKKLADENIVRYVISQNIDGLHLRSGLSRNRVAELHGNMFVEQCDVCRKQFVRSSPAPTVGQKLLGTQCHGERTSGRKCRGKLRDIILDWEHNLPDIDLEMAEKHSSIADLSICLGTTLQIVPSGNLPLNTLKYGGKLVICNLQPTKHDNKADLVINAYVDDVLELLMTELKQEIPLYRTDDDPTRFLSLCDWTICKKQLIQVRSLYKDECAGVIKRRSLVKKNSNMININNINKKPKLDVDIKNESESLPKDCIVKEENLQESSEGKLEKINKLSCSESFEQFNSETNLNKEPIEMQINNLTG